MWNAIVWAWHSHCNHELTEASVSARLVLSKKKSRKGAGDWRGVDRHGKQIRDDGEE